MDSAWTEVTGTSPRPRTPLVIDLPHAGERWPAGITPPNLPAATLAQWRDPGLLAVWHEAAQGLAAIVAARFDRACIDTNRARDDIDPDLLREAWPGPIVPSPFSHRGVGLIRRFAAPGQALQAERLSVADVQQRLALCYDPYHAAIAASLDAVHMRFALSLHLCCVSMNAVGDALSPDTGAARPDVTVGDLDGSSADPLLVRWVAATLQGQGLDVRINHPHRGGELLRRHGHPVRARHSVLLMLNRRLHAGADGDAAVARSRAQLIRQLQCCLGQWAAGLAMELVPPRRASALASVPLIRPLAPRARTAPP